MEKAKPINQLPPRVGTNADEQLVLRFKGERGELEQAILHLQKNIEACDYHIRFGYIYNPTKMQTDYIRYYGGMKDMYSGLLQICFETENESKLRK